MIKQSQSIFASLLILLSCSPEPKEETLKTFEISYEQIDSHFFDVIENLEVTVFEETDSSLFGSIQKVVFDEENVFVLEGKGKRLFKYSIYGEYINSIYSVGNGPNQYNTIDDFLIDDDKLVLLDAQKRRLLYWTKDLKFIQSFSLGFHAYKFEKRNDVFIFDNGYIPPNDTLLSSLIVTDEELNIINGLIPFEKERQYTLASNSIQTVSSESYYRQSFSDTIFYVDVNLSPKPKFILDFGNKWRFGEFNDDGKLYNAMRTPDFLQDDMVSWMDVWNDENIVFLRTVLYPSYLTVGTLIDKSNGKSKNLFLQTNDDPRSALRLIDFNNNGKNFVGLSPDQLNDLLSRTSSKQVRNVNREYFDQTLANENPALLSFNFKE